MAINTRVLVGSLAAAAVISVAGGYALSRDDEPDSEIEIPGPGTYVEPTIRPNLPVEGEQLPEVMIRDTFGDRISTSTLIGQPLVINVWATNCEPCKREMPALARVQRDTGDLVRFIGVNQFANNDLARDYAADKGVAYELMSDQDGELVSALGITGLPYTLFIDSNGTIVAQKGIELSEETIRANVALIVDS